MKIYDRSIMMTKKGINFTSFFSIVSQLYRLFRFSKKLYFKVFSTLFLFEVYQIYLLLECVLRLLSTEFNVMLTKECFFLIMICEFLAAI